MQFVVVLNIVVKCCSCMQRLYCWLTILNCDVNSLSLVISSAPGERIDYELFAGNKATQAEISLRTRTFCYSTNLNPGVTHSNIEVIMSWAMLSIPICCPLIQYLTPFSRWHYSCLQLITITKIIYKLT